MLICSPSVRDNPEPYETPVIISPDLSPPNSTGLNPVDYRNVGRNAAADPASSWRQWTEAALNSVWHRFEQSVIDDSVDEWRKRHCASIGLFVWKDILSI